MAETVSRTMVDERALYAKISWRLIPYMFLLYIVAYMDRVNVGFAAMDMQRELLFSNTVYGTGAGMFFLGYASGNLPSGLMLQRVGTRKWIAWTMMAWGLVSACMVLVGSAGSFYALRFLLGIAEAGFVPGMLLYLTFWFPSHQRAKAVAKFMTATSLAGVVGGPLSSALLKLNGVGGLSGWQWLFLFEGMTTLLVGSSVLFLLRDGPDEAKWLKPEERMWLRGELQCDREMYRTARQEKFSDAFKLPVVWALTGVYVVIQIGVYVVNLWMPLMLSNLTRGGTDSSVIAKYSTLPYLLAAIFTVLVGWSSDRRSERRGHLAACMALAAVGFAWAAVAGNIAVALCAMSLVAIGLFSTMGPFWALTTRMVGGAAAAGGVAIITATGAVGGFLGPYVTGRLRDATHSFAGGLYLISGLSVGAAMLSLVVGRSWRMNSSSNSV
jgi:ACS family tartrate transporter-like MFS transporter